MLASILAGVLAFRLPAEVAEPVVVPDRAAVLTVTLSEGGATLRAEGDRVVIAQGARVLASAPAVTTNRIVIRGEADRDDTLTIDLSQPLHLARGIDYDGGARGFDVLELRGGSAREQRTTQLTPHDGIIDLDGLVIRYSNLEPVTDTTPATTFTIIGTVGSDEVTVDDGPGGTTTVSSPTFESLTFANKTNVVFDGMGGGDTVRFNNPNPATGLVSFIVTGVTEVVQSAPVRYPFLGVSVEDRILLSLETNDVDNFEAYAQTGTIVFTDVDSVNVGGVSPLLAGVTTDSNTLHVQADSDLTVAADAIVSGNITPLNTAAGARLSSKNGAVIVNGTVLATPGNNPVILDSEGTGVVVNGTAAGGSVEFRTTRLVIASTATITAMSEVVIQPPFFGSTVDDIDIGSATDSAPTAIEVSDAELDRLVTPRVRFEAGFGGTIVVSQPITFDGELILDTTNLTATGSGSLSAPVITIRGSGTASRSWTITETTIRLNAGAAVPHTATTLNVAGGLDSEGSGHNDTFIVAPSPTTTINVDGDRPYRPATPGDVLDFELAGVVSPVLTATLGPNGYSGSLTSANRQPVNFVDIETIVDGPVDVGITKSDGAASVTAGTPVTYTIVVTNPGPLAVGGAQVADAFSSQLTAVTWTCTASSPFGVCSAAGSGNLFDVVTIPASSSLTYTVNATVGPSATGTLTNTATVTTPAAFPDTNPANNTATDTNAITTQADLLLAKSTTTTSVMPGADINYTITVRNAGPSSAQNVVLTDVLAAGTTFVSLTAPPAFSCTTGPTVACSIATLAPSATPNTFTLVARVDPATPFGTVLTNTATGTSVSTDPSANTAAAAIIVAPAAIPTLSEWMLILLAAALAMLAMKRP